MLTLTEDDSRRHSTRRNSNRERGKLRRRAAWSFVGAALIAAGFAACGTESITGPRAPEAPTQKFVAGQPQASIVGDDNSSGNSATVQGEEENKCMTPPEVVPMRGKVRFAVFPSGTHRDHVQIHMHWVVDGIGSFKNVYHGASEDAFTINTSSLPPGQVGQTAWTHVHIERLTSRTAPDMFVKFLFHLTMNAAGQMTARVERNPLFEARCNT
jgi:hypothetical protein